MVAIVPTWRTERALWRGGHARVAGIDEVGRGPLAGPVVAGAVVLPYSRARWISELRDSKLLAPEAREALAVKIRQHADWGIGVVSPHVIDQINILRATRLAMFRAVQSLRTPPDHLIVDGREVVDGDVAQQSLIDADALCYSVAAASIIAKVARDQMMRDLDPLFPGYGFAGNKGYASPDHRAALRALGYSTVHRLSYAPVRAAVRR